MFPTPGHTTDHSSFMVQIEDKKALICGDALYTLRYLAVYQIRAFQFKKQMEPDYIKSIQRIKGLLKVMPDNLILLDHDPTAYYTKYLKQLFKEGIISLEKLNELKTYKKSIFGSDYTLKQEFMPPFIP